MLMEGAKCMGPIDALFTAGQVVSTGSDAKKSMQNQMKVGANKYDAILNNTIVKAPEAGGQRNALNANPMFRRASEEIDFLYKAAEFAEDNRRPKKNNQRFQNRDNVRRLESSKSFKPRNNDNRAIKEPSHLVEIKNDREKKEYNPFLTAGGAVLGAAALQALFTKSLKAPVSSIKSGVDDFKYSIPRKTIGKNKHVREVMKTLKTGTKKMNSNLKGQMNASNNYSARNSFNKTVADNVGSSANVASSVGKQTANTSANNKMQTIKKSIRDDFVRSGIEAVPYYLAPAAFGYLAGKNISHPEDDSGVKRIIMDVPSDLMQSTGNKKRKPRQTGKITKEASDISALDLPKNLANDLSWSEWAKTQLPRKALQGLGRSLFPAMVIHSTGRNIKGRLEKLEHNDNADHVKPGDTRIIIETIPTSKDGEKETSPGIKKSAADRAEDAKKIVESIMKDSVEPNDKKVQTLMSYDKMKQGVLKKQRMTKMEG